MENATRGEPRIVLPSSIRLIAAMMPVWSPTRKPIPTLARRGRGNVAKQEDIAAKDGADCAELQWLPVPEEPCCRINCRGSSFPS